MTRKKVVVIGAGLGGISAAVSLASEGYDVHVFEKNRHDQYHTGIRSCY